MYLDLTNKQISVLNFIKEHFKQKNYPPTVREICVAVGLSSPSSVHAHLNKLEKLGYIKRNPDIPRGIEVCDDLHDKIKIDEDLVKLPLVGQITAGMPILAEQNIEEYIPLPHNLIKGSDNFILKVKGDSMINAGILDGDFVVVDRKNTASNSQIVAALINKDSATIKRFFKEEDNIIRLQPENDEMSPIILNENEVDIIGIITGVFRILK